MNEHKIAAGTWRNTEGDELEVQWSVMAAQDFYTIADDICIAEGFKAGKKRDFLVTEYSLNSAGFSPAVLVPAKDET